MMRFPLLIIGILCYASSAWAVLGGAPAHLTTDQRSVTAMMHAAGAATIGIYTQIDTTLPSGTLVREYVSNGTVFAVAWKGPFLPDLKTLLGPHFDAMTTEAAKTTKAGHSQLTVNHPDLVIQSGGHMRAFEGRAWIPSLLPSGMDTKDIHL
ncbi:MAG TPA: DUF2844 domain-containing protein [Burkholderiaceae bacterium]